MLRTLLAQIKQYKKASWLAILFGALEVGADIAIPYLIALIIDYGIIPKNMAEIYHYGGIMVAVVLSGLLTGIAAGIFSSKASTGYAYNLRDSIFGNVQTFSFSNIDKFSTPSLITRMTTDVTNIQNAYQMMVRMGLRAPLMLVSALIMSIIISPQMSLIFISAIAFLAFAIFLIVRKVKPMMMEVFRGYDDLNASVQENVNAIRVVKGFVREPHEKSKFNKSVQHLYEKFVKAEGTMVLNSPVMMTAIYGSIIAISWIGAHFIVGGTLTTGELTSLFTYVMNILMGLMMLSMIFVMLTLSIASAERIAEVLDEQPDIKNPENPVMKVKNGAVSFKDVNFSYKKKGKKYVLSDINIDIKAGETIGIIGGTGSSKSSMVNLISRLYDTTCGEVTVGGINVKNYDLKTLRDNVAVVLQKNRLFSGTIYENLRWGNKNATDEECIVACKMACADGFISSFTDGYNTYIEQGGTNVSGGQKQRLCIARALLKKPKIIIFDDSTSAVDTNTDSAIRQSLIDKIPDTTKFFISQRISTVKDADRIIILDDGKINAVGTHEELLKTSSIYQTICKNQENNGDFDKKESK